MPKAETTGRFTVYMHRNAIDDVAAFAKERGYKSTAEYARALIEQDMTAHGREIDVGIDTWGRHSDKPPAAGDDTPKRTRKKKCDA